MSNDRKDYKLYLIDIKISCIRILRYTKNKSENQFVNNQALIDAVARNIEIIGEAAKHIPHEIRLKYVQVPWKEIIGARSKMIHEYFGVDTDILWKTIKEDIPFLKKQISTLKK